MEERRHSKRHTRWQGETTILDLNEVVKARDRVEPRHPVLTVISGQQMGRSLIMEQPRALAGRDRECTLFLSDSGVSRRHAEFERLEDRRVLLRDLNSTNGTFLNGRKISEVEVKDGDNIHLGPVAVIGFGYESLTEHQLHIRQYEQAVRDGLTGIFNRRYLMRALRTEIAFAQRYRDPLSLFLFDIDHFKRINDTHGHRVGDEVICRMVEAVNDSLRREDIFARYGGEEFAVLLRGLNGEQARDCAERVRLLVESLRTSYEGLELAATISGGVATLVEGSEGNAETMMGHADACLYEAKAAGRNRVMGPREA